MSESDQACVTVTLASAFEPFTSGPQTFQMAVGSMRAVLRELDARYPGLAALLEEESAVAIDGVIHDIIYTQPLASGSDVYFIARLESG